MNILQTRKQLYKTKAEEYDIRKLCKILYTFNIHVDNEFVFFIYILK